jgi:hypothetical protein
MELNKGILQRANFGYNRGWKTMADYCRFINFQAFPRQMTLLKLIYLRLEELNGYDIDTIEQMREGWDLSERCGCPPDIWERIDYLRKNGYRRFTRVLIAGGRRFGKGALGEILGSETVEWLHSMGNPQKELGIREGRVIDLVFFATSLSQAQRYLFADTRSGIERNKNLKDYITTSNSISVEVQTDFDRLQEELARSKKHKIKNKASIRVGAYGATSSSARGGQVALAGLDELAFGQNTGSGSSRDIQQLISAIKPSLDQMGVNAFQYVPSSPSSKVGPFYEIYTEGSELLEEYTGIPNDIADPSSLVLQLPSWWAYEDYKLAEELYGWKTVEPIQVVPDSNGTERQRRMAREERADPSSFRVERRAQFAEVVDGYLDPDKVDSIFKPWKGSELNCSYKGSFGKQYIIHCDLSTVNCNTAIAIGHLEPAEEPEVDGLIYNHVIIDYMKVWKPEEMESHTINYIELLKEFKQLILDFRPYRFSFDQFNSAFFISALSDFCQEQGVPCKVEEETFTKSRNMEVAELTKRSINQNWVHSFLDSFMNPLVDRTSSFELKAGASLLNLELKYLQLRGGQVEKQTFGPVKTKDLADCFMVVTSILLESQVRDNQIANLSATAARDNSSSYYSQFSKNYKSSLDSLQDPRRR